MKEKFDYIYLTNTPSFYKVNLARGLARLGVKGMLVFNGYGSEAVNTLLRDNSVTENGLLKFKFLNEGDNSRRSKYHTFRALLRLMKEVDAHRIVFAGWMVPEYNLFSFLSPRQRNVVVIESTIMDSTVTGVKGWLKRRILRRMSRALSCGARSSQLLSGLRFKGEIFTTGSVGLIASPGRPPLPHQFSSPLRSIYVGRLESMKNLHWLIEQFNRSGRPLTIVGAGSLDKQLRSFALPNISFAGFVDNNLLEEVFSEHHLLILPSSSETWGLVIEEALYHGLPVLVSDRVGAAPELVESTGAGRIFRFDDTDDFERSIADIEQNYANFAEAAAAIDFDSRACSQLNAWLSALS